MRSVALRGKYEVFKETEMAFGSAPRGLPRILQWLLAGLMALIGLAAKLPPHLAEERPRLQTNLASQLILHNFEMIDV